MSVFDDLPSDFWENNISRSLSKDDIEPEAWERITKVRNSPIELRRKIQLGPLNKAHIVLPKGLKGYLIDFPEAFGLCEEDLQQIRTSWVVDFLPAIFGGYSELVFLTDKDYKIISPFFDPSLADFAACYKVNNYE